jgi:peptidoglycan-associated lipoprotein
MTKLSLATIMKSPFLNSHRLCAFGLVLLAAGAGCAKKGQGVYNPDMGDASENVLPVRPPGINPDTDVDWEPLAPYTIYFAYDSSTIRSDQRSKLDKIQEWMEQNPGRRLFLAGHTDDRGTLEYNRGLGERRALAVRDYLIGLGANGAEIFTISYGEERPASEGASEDDYAKNRRVQVGIVIR